MSPEKATIAAAAPIAYRGERRRQAVAVNMTSRGTAQTQWWAQEIGEISRPVIAQQITPASR